MLLLHGFVGATRNKYKQKAQGLKGERIARLEEDSCFYPNFTPKKALGTRNNNHTYLEIARLVSG